MNIEKKCERKSYINIYIGCIYCCKILEILDEAIKEMDDGRKVLCINHIDDNSKYGIDTYLYAHDREKTKCVRVEHLKVISEENILDVDFILIIKAQFFTGGLVETYNKDIIVTGLNGDYKRNEFGEILDLIPYANNVTKKAALCSLCGNGEHAHFPNPLTNSKEQVCRFHYNKLLHCKTEQ